MDREEEKNVINVMNDKRVEGGREEGTEDGWQRKGGKESLERVKQRLEERNRRRVIYR